MQRELNRMQIIERNRRVNDYLDEYLEYYSGERLICTLDCLQYGRFDEMAIAYINILKEELVTLRDDKLNMRVYLNNNDWFKFGSSLNPFMHKLYKMLADVYIDYDGVKQNFEAIIEELDYRKSSMGYESVIEKLIDLREALKTSFDYVVEQYNFVHQNTEPDSNASGSDESTEESTEEE